MNALAAVVGITVIISIDDLLPASRSFGEDHLSIVSAVVGMALTALRLWMLQSTASIAKLEHLFSRNKPTKEV